MCGTSFNKFDRTINLKPMQRAELIEVVEPMTDTIPFPLVKLRLFNDTEFKTNDDDQALLKILMDEM